MADDKKININEVARGVIGTTGSALMAANDPADKGKPFFKKFKVLVALATGIMQVTGTIVIALAPDLKESVMQLMGAVLAIGVSVIAGHSVTDAANALSKK